MPDNLRHRVSKPYTPQSWHEVTCRHCFKQFKSRGTGQSCRACWQKHHGRKKQPTS